MVGIEDLLAWTTFLGLDRERQPNEYGLPPITMQKVEHWLNVYGVTDPDIVLATYQVVRLLDDNERVAHVNAVEKSRKEAERKRN